MKKLIIAAWLLASVNSLKAQVEKLAIGASIPMATTKMHAVDGKEYSVNDLLTKKGVLVMFSCNTCPFVVKYQTRTKSVLKDAKEKGIGIIIVNSNEAYRGEEDSYDAMKAYAKAQGYTVPYVVDDKSALADAFNANRTPECFLFDGSGKLVYHGAIDTDPNDPASKQTMLLNAMNELAAGKDVAVKESRSIGCSIKRAGM